jgi:peptidoglycan-N-acetylglucosamine deacetylase
MFLAKVPVLVTWDVDPDRWTTLENRQHALGLALDLCQEFNIRSTFFITARFALEYPEQIQRMLSLGQEIGCHGLTHADDEDYDRMPQEMQRSYIEEATRELEAVADAPVTAFRSPRVKTSGCTLGLLAERGYRVDSSVCSQRIDFLSSNLINPGWLFAPRHPYHPHHLNAYRRGDLPIWEIPISALVAPWISSSLNVFGLRFMKALFRLLRVEARQTGKPLVYLAHPTELLPSTHRRKNVHFRQLSPRLIRTHGLLLRNVFFRMDGVAWYRATRELFAYMASFPDVGCMTSSEYAALLDTHPGNLLSDVVGCSQQDRKMAEVISSNPPQE